MKEIHGGDIWSAARGMGLEPGEVADFSASINPIGMSPGAVRAIKGALGPTVSAYPDPEARGLRRALSELHGLPPGNILPGNGSIELIYAIPGALRARKALIVEPAFSEYRRALGLAGAKVRAHTLSEKDAFTPDAERLGRAVRSGGFDVLYIANPANPTGAPVEKDLLIELVKCCGRNRVTLVVDEAFCDFAEGLSMKKEVLKHENLVVLRSMTKFFAMAGLRLGFAFAHEKMLRKLKAHMPPWSVNTLAGAAAEASLKDAAYMKKTLTVVKREKRFLMERLSAIKGLRVYPSAANFFMLKVFGAAVTAPELARKLSEKGILVRGLGGFKGLGPEYLRIAVKGRRDNARLAEALSSILGT